MKFSSRTIVILLPFVAAVTTLVALHRKEEYVPVADLCSALAAGDLDSVNSGIRYGEFYRDQDDLLFRYSNRDDKSCVVEWGDISDIMKVLRQSRIVHVLGTTRLVPMNETMPRSKLHEVIFQTNRRDGKVAIMDGGSNAFTSYER
ncbi:MAG: hypothetical protein AAFX06_15710 [Planctomycetota bacterium]